MREENSLERFIIAQKTTYVVALAEIKAGRKRSHWMWYIFPQLRGLGFSEASQYYGIKDLNEAEAYLRHPLLGARLAESCRALLTLSESDARTVFGAPDDLKLKSSMTLFSLVPQTDTVFDAVLEKFFHGSKDAKTIDLLKG